MIILDATTKKLQIVLSGAITTNQLPFVASYVDFTTTTYVPGESDGTSNSTTAVDAVAAPGASTQRQIKLLVIRNADTVASTVTVRYLNNVTARDIITITLSVGDQLVYTDGEGFRVLNSSGALVQSGATGATGPAGPASTVMFFPEEPPDPPPAMLMAPVNSWIFLGTISGTGVTVGPLIWTETFDLIYFKYIIGGYNGGTPVGRLLCGSAAISTTALTNGNGLLSDGAKTATSVSVPGCPLAVTLSAIARQGVGWISGASGAFKQIDIIGKNGNPAAATSPTTFSASSFFTDLGTNLPIQRMQLTVYDTLIATAASAQTFTATTQLWAWGIRQI